MNASNSQNITIATLDFYFFLILKDFIYFIFRERGREGEREEEKYQKVASYTPPTWVLGQNSGMCPDQELNRQPFGSQTDTQSTEPHQPGQHFVHSI